MINAKILAKILNDLFVEGYWGDIDPYWFTLVAEKEESSSEDSDKLEDEEVGDDEVLQLEELLEKAAKIINSMVSKKTIISTEK
jgi:hypothetical protein